MGRVVLFARVEDPAEWLQSPAVAEAMSGDGVISDSVKVFVLDREFRTP